MSEPASAPLEPNLRQPAADLGPRAQRTIEAILDATREIFLTSGYGGTSIDAIASRAGVSRASFYTYFPSKRDVLLALGSGATREAREAVAALDALPDDWSVADLEAWLQQMLTFLDSYGSFGSAWNEAAYEDPTLREAGMRTNLRTCELLGARLNALAGTAVADDAHLGLLLFSMLERTWAQQKLYHPTVSSTDLVTAAARLLAAMLGRA